MFSLADFRAAADIIGRHMAPTPQYAWPLLADELGVETWVKHENHTPTGAFKLRGGLVYVTRLRRDRPEVKGVVSATRGNHGQSIAFAARSAGLPCTIVVPHGNSAEKNAAMRALGADLIEAGADFEAAKAVAADVAATRGFEMVPSFHPDLVLGVGTYGIELLSAVPDLDVVFCPIGMGSGICGLVHAKAALGHRVSIVGVVSDTAPGYRLSMEAGRPIATDAPASTFADGMAVRAPSAEALEVMKAGVSRIVEVDDDSIADAARRLFSTTHNLAEGAGAAALAALTAERQRWHGAKAAVILSGGNIDRAWFRTVLDGGTPHPAAA
ncbi:threonine dehydratase [Pinisolibacter sp.]|uniref:threonine dehydratase n=1 Tax=Pinisolibacter sp. TaxID=2172024 RepID=UPI002FDEE44E